MGRLAMLTLLIATLLVGCRTPGAAPPATPVAGALGESVALGPVRMTIAAADWYPADAFRRSAGVRCLVLDVTLENESAAVVDPYWDMDWEIRDASGRRFSDDSDCWGAGGATPRLSGEIEAGERLRGTLAFAVADDADELVAHVELTEHRDLSGLNFFDPTAIANAMATAAANPVKRLGQAEITLGT